MATVQFRLRSNADKNVSIKVRVSLNRETRFELNTGFSINPKDWSKTTDRPKQNTTENKQIFNSLKKLESFIFENLNTDLGKGIIIDPLWLESKINECFNRVEKVDVGLITNHTQHIIDNANTRKVTGKNKLGLSESRVKGYTTFKHLFEKYEAVLRKKVHFLDINKTFVDKFTNWLINTENYSMNYAGKQIDNLKTVCLDAEKSNIPTNPYINQIQGFSESDDERYIQTLSFEELEKIRTADITKPELVNARKWLLIGCEIGQRGGDLMNITSDNIRYKNGNMFLDIIQQKTNKNVTIPVCDPHVIEIIENEMPHKISSQKLNDYIKLVAQKAGLTEMVEGSKLIVSKTGKKVLSDNGKLVDEKIRRKKIDIYPKWELITSHSFRRSFATNYYKKMPTAVLIGITGHSKESLFLSYINKREDKDTNAELFMKFYEDVQKTNTPTMKVIKNAGNQ